MQFAEFPISTPEPNDRTMYHLLASIDRGLQLVTLGHQVRTLQSHTFQISGGMAEGMSVLSLLFFF
jgi:ABC-type dipeptide/oligopeptide/nickel transport system ATPase component